MFSKGVSTQLSGRRRAQVSHWKARLLIVLISLVLSTIIVLFFFSSGAVSR
jgi:hypothetical protein